jgi:hypothetical protein
VNLEAMTSEELRDVADIGPAINHQRAARHFSHDRDEVPNRSPLGGCGASESVNQLPRKPANPIWSVNALNQHSSYQESYGTLP